MYKSYNYFYSNRVFFHEDKYTEYGHIMKKSVKDRCLNVFFLKNTQDSVASSDR